MAAKMAQSVHSGRYLMKMRAMRAETHDEVELLEAERPFPVDAHHPHHPKVPHDHRDGEVVDWNVVRHKYFSVNGRK